MKFHQAIFALFATASIARCATFTWTGAVDGSWNTAANWSTGIPASAGTTALVFDNAVQPTTNNNIPGELTINSLSIGSASGVRSFSGNLLKFSGTSPHITRSSGTGDVVVGNNVRLDANLRLLAPTTFTSQIGISGIISGTGGVIADEGVSVVSGANTYTGPTIVRSGALLGVLGQGVAATSGITVETDGEFQLLRDTFINKPLALSGGLTSAGRQNVILVLTSPSVSYDGAVTVTGDSEIRAFGGTNASLESRVDFPITGAVSLSEGQLIASTGGPGNKLRFTNTISGTGDLNISASGGSISFEGINLDGTISASGPSGMPTVKTLAGNGSLEIDVDSAFGGLSISGAVSGNRDISVVSGELQLQSPLNSFTGTIDITTDGSLSGQTNASLGNVANPVVFTNGGILSFTSSGNLGNPITTTGGTGLFSSPGFSGTISSNISGDGGFGFFNFGPNAIYTLTGTNTFQGGLAIGSGSIIAFSQDANLGAAGGPLIFSGGALSLPPGYSLLSRPIEITDGNIGGNAGITHEFTGDISGSGRFVLGGGPTFILSGTNSFTGQLAAIGENGGPATTLVVSDDSKLGAPGATLQLGEQSGIFVRPGALRATGNLNIAATRETTYRQATIDTNGFNVTFNQPFSGRGLIKTGAGILRLNTVNPDTSGENEVKVSQGLLRLGVSHAFGSRASVTAMDAGGVLDLNGFSLELATVQNIDPAAEISLGAGTLTIRSGGGIDGSITGPGGVVIGKSGFSGSSCTFGGVNTFSGGLSIVNGCDLTLQNVAGLGAPGNPISIDDGTLSTGSLLSSPLVIDSSVNLLIGSGGARFSAGGQSIIIQSLLSGTNPIRFGGGSSPFEEDIYDVLLANPANSFTGPIQLGQSDSSNNASCIVGIVANGSLGNPANVVTLGASYFDGESMRVSTGGLRAYAELTIPASRTIRLDGDGGVMDTNGRVLTIATAITELAPESDLLKDGEGSLILNAANTYTGETNVRRGTLGGNGSIAGRLSMNSEGVIAPGSPSAIGAFTCVDIDLTNGGSYLVNLASGSGADKLVANGEVFLSTGVSIIVQPTGQVTQGDVFMILQKSGAAPIDGTFEQAGTFSSGGVDWSINYSGGDGNDITITALTGSATAAALPVLSGLVITPAGAGGSGGLARISATITGGVPNTSIFLEASSDLGILDVWETIQTIPLDPTGAATINNVTDPNSSGLPRNFFRLRVP